MPGKLVSLVPRQEPERLSMEALATDSSAIPASWNIPPLSRFETAPQPPTYQQGSPGVLASGSDPLRRTHNTTYYCSISMVWTVEEGLATTMEGEEGRQRPEG